MLILIQSSLKIPEDFLEYLSIQSEILFYHKFQKVDQDQHAQMMMEFQNISIKQR